MLILTRFSGQSFSMNVDDIDPEMTVHELFGGNNIRVRVLTVDAGQASLGIDAPRAIKILRSELEDAA